MPRAANSVDVGRRVKKETAVVLYNDLDATLTGNISDTAIAFEFLATFFHVPWPEQVDAAIGKRRRWFLSFFGKVYHFLLLDIRS